ncbi:MaoC/PaaZ C-terminal domain-containing protein [Cupriavidus necator]|uniref:MaoC/PaaZ C-terminal domain-containing protein n=1 Tax=Cupriavidus necator TaxID=106590 RepID=UPI0039C1E791
MLDYQKTRHWTSPPRFTRPILQGLATYGMACQLLLKTYCDYDPGRLTSIGARLSAPVFPGETLQLDCWESGDEISFQARVVERDVIVLSHGRAEVDVSSYATLPKSN